MTRAMGAEASTDLAKAKPQPEENTTPPPKKDPQEAQPKVPDQPPPKEKGPAKEETPPQKGEKEVAPKEKEPSEKQPVPKTAEKPQPKEKQPKEDLPPEIKALIAKLRGGSNEEKIAAGEGLGAQGQKAKGASRALCEAATNPGKDVSRSALQALEKVNPDLYEPVFTLVVDGQAANHRKAIASLRKQKEKAKPTMPVLLHNAKKCLTDFEEAMRTGRGSIGWQTNTLQLVTIDLLRSLPEIAPEDPNALLVISQAAGMKQLRFDGQALPVAGPFRSAAVPLLGTVAEKSPALRKQITPVLTPLLDESVKRLGSHSTEKNLKAFGQLSQVLKRDFSEIELVGEALLQCGPEANEVFKRKFIPVLKELEFHDDAGVRSDAKALRKRLESPDKADSSAFTKTGG